MPSQDRKPQLIESARTVLKARVVDVEDLITLANGFVDEHETSRESVIPRERNGLWASRFRETLCALKKREE